MSGAMIGAKTVTGMAFGGVSIAGLCKGGTVVWRKPVESWTDWTDWFVEYASREDGVTVEKDGADWVLTTTKTIAAGAKFLSINWIGSLSEIAGWPETGTLRITGFESDFSFKSIFWLGNGDAITTGASPFEVSTTTSSKYSGWWTLRPVGALAAGTYRFRLKIETKETS